ncbi:MAG: tetratricopeptide repeat-containing glycosyltransferase family 2 protein [Syntrophobacteraceae bacterium]
MSQSLLSLCMIVRDEIDCLERCLDSVKEVVDEIIIVDTGSRDGTLELAKRHASRVAQITWRDDFSHARNVALDMASGDWILSLDADHYLRRESCPDLLEALRVPDALACRVMIRDHHDGGYCETTPCTKLFRRLPGIRYRGRIHEQVTSALQEFVRANPGWRSVTLDRVIVEHDGYMQKRSKGESKGARNLRLLTMALEEDPSDIYRRYKLAQLLGVETDEGYRHLSFALEELLALSDCEIQELAFAYELLGNGALRSAERDEPAKSLRVSMIAESLFGKHPVLSYARALSYYSLGNSDVALTSAEEALAIAPGADGFVFNPGWLRQEIYFLISRIQQGRSEHAAAIEALRSAVAESPDSRQLVHSQMRTALAAGAPLVALEYGARSLRSNGVDAQCLLVCAEAAEMYGDLASAAKWRSLAGGISHS